MGQKGGKGKGKGKGSKGQRSWGKQKQKKKEAKEATRKADPMGGRKLPEDDLDEGDVFWRPTWDTLGPLQEVKEKVQRNKMGRKRDKSTEDFGLGVVMTKVPKMVSEKSLKAAEEAAKPGPGQTKRAVKQRERRQRKLALEMNSPRPLSLEDAKKREPVTISSGAGAVDTLAVRPVKKKILKRRRLRADS